MAKAAHTVKEVPVNRIEKLISGTYENKTKIVAYDEDSDDPIRVEIKSLLTYDEYAEFVGRVVRDCFSEDQKDYDSYCKSFSIMLNMIRFYTNVRIPKEETKYYRFLMDTQVGRKFISEIREFADPTQYRDLLNAIDTKIEFNKQIICHSRRYSDLYEKLTEIEETFALLSSLIEPQKVNDVLNILTNMKDITGQGFIQAMIDNNMIGTEQSKASIHIEAK